MWEKMSIFIWLKSFRYYSYALSHALGPVFAISVTTVHLLRVATIQQAFLISGNPPPVLAANFYQPPKAEIA
jgi:hypothetical protein